MDCVAYTRRQVVVTTACNPDPTLVHLGLQGYCK